MEATVSARLLQIEGGHMRKELQQMVSAYEGWEAVFFSYNDGNLFRQPIICWAFVSERPHVENGVDEEKYFEGMVLVDDGTQIGGINETPDDIGFLGCLYTKQSRKKIKERMDYFKDQASQLMKIRTSGHLPDRKIGGAKGTGKKANS